MYKLELSREMVGVIADALANAPYRMSAPVIAEMQKQINEQQPKANGNGHERTVVPSDAEVGERRP